MSTFHWATTRVYYHEEDKDRLISHGLWPEVEKCLAEKTALAGYFNRHWKGGPHVKIALYQRAARAATSQQRVVTAADRFLRGHPSRAALSEAQLRLRSACLGRLEADTEPEPIRPDNHIECLIGDDVRAAALGGDVGLEIARSFYCRSSPIAAKVLSAHVDRTVSKFDIAFLMMIATVSYFGDIRTSCMSYKSHVEGFLGEHDSGNTLRGRMEHSFQREVDRISELVAYAIGDKSSIEMPALASEVLKAWASLIRATFPIAHQALQRGDIDLFNDAIVTKQRAVEQSEYHKLTGSNPRVNEYIKTPHFLARRFVINLQYEVLHQLGISPVQKNLLCHYVVEGICCQAHTTWREVVERW
jgi:hypothetical protein